MKKCLFLILMCIPAALMAQNWNGITSSDLAVANGTVTFNIRWDRDAMPETVWSDTVWVWVDYNNAGMMERLPLVSGGATLTDASPGGKVVAAPGNDRGVWVVGNARSAGSFSATVKLLTVPADFSGACAYASNYPPVGEYLSATEIAFTGTPPYEVVLDNGDGTTTQTVESSPYRIPDTYKVQSFTDKTGAPGVIKCISVATPTITASASTVCQNESLVFTVPFAANTTYTWTASAGTSSSNSYTFDTSTDGAKTATVYSEVTEGGVTCQSAVSAVETSTVQALPTAPTITPSASTVCQNGSLEFTVPSAANTTYTWAASAGTSSSNSYTFDTSTDGAKTATVYSEVLADGVTCQSANADTVTATVNALPANPTVTAGARCGSGTVTLTASSSDNDVVIDWYETLSDETALASGNDTYTTPSLDAGTTYYTQARNTSTGCISASREAVATAINAPATITTHPVSQTFCEATISPTLTVAATAGSGNTLTYKWKEGATGMDVGSNSSSYTPTVTATTEYWVVVTDNNSCSVTSDKAKIAVSAPVAGEIGTACTGNTGGKIGI